MKTISKMQLCPQISVTKQNCEVNLDPTARNLFMAPEWTPPPPKRVLCLMLHGWPVFPSWPPFVWHWPPPTSNPSNSRHPGALSTPVHVNVKARHAPLQGPWGDPFFFFFFPKVRVLRWQVRWCLNRGGGGFKDRVVCMGLTHSHSLTTSEWEDGRLR